MATNFFENVIEITTIPFELEDGTKRDVDILRLDKLHDIISGNKWFKLKWNIEAAKKFDCKTLLSFGGAYSNHLHALAYAGKLLGFKTIGYVRGEEVSNPTLQDCEAWGMELHFISRENYRRKTNDDFLLELRQKHTDCYIIPEGGDNDLGQKGCEEILTETVKLQYDLIGCCIGTGTTFAGLRKSFDKELLGFCALKNGQYLEAKLLNEKAAWSKIYFDKTFGGFGKMNQELIEFTLAFKEKYKIELDLIYNAKMFFALKRMLSDSVYKEKKLLVIHTGGIQGNRSQKEFNLGSY